MFHVKPNDPDTMLDSATIATALRDAGVVATPRQCDLLAAHAARVVRANATMNLTRIVSPEGVLALHVVDSLAFLQHVAPLLGKVIDIGSGAGYPGIPLAIMGLDVVLCESSQKKARFLEECVADLGLRCAVKALRAEEVAIQLPGGAQVVVARAVTALASLIELAAPLLGEDGRLIALKGRPDQIERTQGATAAVLCGMRQVALEEYVLPGGELRSVFVFERSGRPKLRLPRRTGLAQRQALGK